MHNKHKLHENKNGSVFASYIATVLIVMLVISVFSIVKAQADIVPTANTEDVSAAAYVQAQSDGVSAPVYLFFVQRIPSYSLEDIAAMDLTQPSNVTYEDLCAVSQNGLVGLEQYFINAEQQYGVNCVFLMSIAALESGWGTSLFRQNNLFGFGQYDFTSKEECIYTVAEALSTNYLADDGIYYSGKTINAVWTRYATSTTWGYKIQNIMFKLYAQIRQNNIEKYAVSGE
jgi:beta-N-acetylglucosaminidase